MIRARQGSPAERSSPVTCSHDLAPRGFAERDDLPALAGRRRGEHDDVHLDLGLAGRVVDHPRAHFADRAPKTSSPADWAKARHSDSKCGPTTVARNAARWSAQTDLPCPRVCTCLGVGFIIEAGSSQNLFLGVHVGGDMRTLLTDLSGAPIEQKPNDKGHGLFEGQVTIRNIIIRDDRVRFELCFPTSRLDHDDYILPSERHAGTTDKVRIMQARRQIDARVVAIRRHGAESHCDEQGPEEYCLIFDAPRYLEGAQGNEPLQVEFIEKRVIAAAGRSRLSF